ncbi:unnamed protein product [Rotaria sp. Silwood2]|nr:unnamed protein product [Rotaria sp. Silwood2]
MSESYILHDVMRKVKADGLFDSIRRDLISDIEQKSSYLDLKSQIESLMSSYLSEHKWSSSLKKSDIRERARRHIETSNLIKDTLPSLVNQYMQTCQQQLVQPRLSSFVSDHIQHVYNSIGGTHIYRPTPTPYTQSNTTLQESLNQEKTSPSIKQEQISSKTNQTPQSSNIIQKKIPSSSLSISNKNKSLTNSIKEEKKHHILSPLHSPNELVDISPSPPSIDNERTNISLSPSPPPPIVRIASPLTLPTNTEIPRKIKHLQEHNDESLNTNIKKKKIKTDDIQHKTISEEKSDDVLPISTSNEADTRKLRPRRPNPKYSKEQFETGDLDITEPSSPSPPPSTISKTKKTRSLKSSTSFEQEHFDTPSSPCATSAPMETAPTVGDISPEYETSLPSPMIEQQQQQQTEKINERSRTPSPVTVDTKKSTSPRRLRPRKINERSSTVENQNEKTADLWTRLSTKTRESNRHRTEQTIISSTRDDSELQQQTTTKKTRLSSSSSSTTENSSKDLPNRSISVPDNLNTATDDTQTTRVSPTPITTPVSKSFIWKPKISK